MGSSELAVVAAAPVGDTVAVPSARTTASDFPACWKHARDWWEERLADLPETDRAARTQELLDELQRRQQDFEEPGWYEHAVAAYREYLLLKDADWYEDAVAADRAHREEPYDREIAAVQAEWREQEIARKMGLPVAVYRGVKRLMGRAALGVRARRRGAGTARRPSHIHGVIGRRRRPVRP